MKKGINIWSFSDQLSIAECAHIAKDAGFAGIELSLNAEGELGLDVTDSQLSAIRETVTSEGLEISGLATGLYWEYAMTSDDPATRQQAIDICRKQLEVAAALEVDTILVIPGGVGVDFIPDYAVIAYDVAYERSLEAISTLSKEAQAVGVQIGIENVWNKFLLSPLEMKTFLEEIHSDYVGSYFDVGNVVYSGYPEHWIAILGQYIKKVHFKDYRREVGGLAGFVDLLAGDVNYPAVVAALRKIGYTNYVTAEMIPAYKYHSNQIIYNTSYSMDAILA
ncbi:sugar phosphate isomerase/epimerase family protein [Paenibacillus nuruki]|uniref:sugar phosphate isomerase/epimerase family protein n=1 Tax=Paenibacillus nuruki TaxID=1886670 RepID=UPI0028039572|nr:sugar phosphate isomerase/epimerase family protein [Paenibacillus nuruki]CAJ1316575.1 AP-endonuc-2 domain-containing protein [Paenibacillus nuruki]